MEAKESCFYCGKTRMGKSGQLSPLLGGYLLSNWDGSRLFLLPVIVTVFGSYFYWRDRRLNEIVLKSLLN